VLKLITSNNNRTSPLQGSALDLLGLAERVVRLGQNLSSKLGSWK